jgi:hypothetical protein
MVRSKKLLALALGLATYNRPKHDAAEEPDHDADAPPATPTPPEEPTK